MVSSNFLTIDEVVANAMMAMNNEDSRDLMVFRKWVYDALRLIGPSNLDIKDEKVEICDFSFPKPCGFISPIKIYLGGDNCVYTHTIEYNQHKNIYECNGCNKEIKISETHNQFHLSSNASEFSCAKIKFFAIPTSPEGEILVNEDYMYPIVAFIEFMNLKRMKNSDPQSISTGDVIAFENRWKMEMARVKGNAKMPSILNASTIMRHWMTMIPNMKYNQF